MKALLVLLAIAAAVWLFRRGRRTSVARPHTPPPARSSPQPMLRCARCGVHLPAGDAIVGRDGRAWCCAAHRQDAAPR